VVAGLQIESAMAHLPPRGIFSALALTALASGCAPENQTAQQQERAEALFSVNCAACHGNPATGAPTRAALKTRTPQAIEAALTTGLMREQGRGLSADDRRLLANYLGAGAATSIGASCKGRLDLTDPAGWNRWGGNIENTRYQPGEKGGITPQNIANLELKWAFGFPAASRARSQPAVTPQAIFTGSQDGQVYALDTKTGCVWWSFMADSEVRSAPTLSVDLAGKIDRIYFGDFKANVYALDAVSGRLLWKRSVQDHPAGTITGSPTLHGGRLFVPMSSTEVVSAMDGTYRCCSFQGGIAALDAGTGKPIWRLKTTDTPRVLGKNALGVERLGPSGAPVWSPPTIDAKRGLLYFGTGENYSSPANGMSDAIIAADLKTGRVLWVRQVTRNDAWNASCLRKGKDANCPSEDGPDFDFGAPPILATLPSGKEILLAGQKSGMVYALDPQKAGKIVWSRRVGMGGFNGGVHWGMATDGRTLYVGVADTPGNKGAVGAQRPGVHALDAATGRPVWSHLEDPICAERSFRCETAISAPVTLTDGLVVGGAHNGLLRAYSTRDGKLLASIDTKPSVSTVNGVKAQGGSIDSAGPVIAGQRLIVNSGYDKFGEIPGNVLLVYGPKEGNSAK